MSINVTDKIQRIKPRLGFGRMRELDLLLRLAAICDGMTGNPAYPKPPVDMDTFAAGIATYSELITAALDGGKKAVSEKRKQREVVMKMATQLGHYVQHASDNDLAKFNTSGFVAASNIRTLPQPLPPATLKWVALGPFTGQIRVKVRGLVDAIIYDVRYAVLGAGGIVGPWTTVMLTSPKAEIFENLTPGGTYVFQVRALGRLGYTDWSDSTTFICG